MKGKKKINGEWVDWEYDSVCNGTLGFIQDMELDEIIPWFVLYVAGVRKLESRFNVGQFISMEEAIEIPSLSFLYIGIMATRIVQLSNRKIGVVWRRPGWGRYDSRYFPHSLALTTNNGTVIEKMIADDELTKIRNKIDGFLQCDCDHNDGHVDYGRIVKNHGVEICDMVYGALGLNEMQAKGEK